MTDDIFFASVTELGQKLKAREFSVVELTKAFSARLETIGPRLNALALPLTEIALRAAKDIDGDIKRGLFRSPLQGVPFAVKDLLSFAGHPTTWGAKPYAGQVFDETATSVQKLIDGGSVLIGKLAMVELAGGGGYRMAGASLFGAGLNPWNRDRWSGGSSSGPASAVAAGLVPFALGSETSGSIISPSAYCGITGLRPTYGYVSRHGAMSLSWTMDKIGPMCRSAEDCGIVLQAIAGADSKDPGSAGRSFYHTPQYSRKITDLTIGYSPDDLDWADAESRPALEQAMSTVRGFGAKLVEVSLPDFPFGSLTDIVIGSEGGAVFENLIQSGKADELADPSQTAGLKANLEVLAKDYLRAMRIRTLLKQKFHELFSTVDALVAPARYNTAPPVNEPLDGPDPAPSGKPKSTGMRSLIPAGNLAGLPAISVPCGFAAGLPVALQFCGPAFSENTLIALAGVFQNKTDWHRHRPLLQN